MDDDKIILDKVELKNLEEMHRKLSEKKDADKVKAIILLSKGWSYPQIEEALLLDERTIHRYRNKYILGGVEDLLDNKYKGKFCKLSESEKKQLSKEFRKNIYPNAAAVCNFIKKRFGKRYTPQGIVPLLHSLGFSYKKTKPIPGKLDPLKQEAFIKEYEKAKKQEKKLYFCDSVHPTYNMQPDYAWLPTREETFVKSNPGRQRLNIVGAYSPDDNSIIASDYESVDADAICDLMKKIRKANPCAEWEMLILDNARYNYNKKVFNTAAELKIELKYLPAYSPNLNLIERLWHLLKKEVLANRYYERYEDFRESCLRFLRRRSKEFKEKLAGLMTENFHLFPLADN
jgi:transposase